MNDFMISGSLFGLINKVDSGYIVTDILYIITIMTIISIITNEHFKYTIYNKCKYILKYFDRSYYVSIKCEDTHLSLRFRAIMHSIGIHKNETITMLIENMQMKWSNKLNNFEEDKNITWKINQSTKFKITDNIFGTVYYYQKEKYSLNDNKMTFIDMSELVLCSSILSVKEITEWIDKQLDIYETFIKGKTLDKQYLIEVSYNNKISDIEYLYTPWTSNVTFDNRFFTDKQMIVDKIKFFINNPEWYKSRGIPYTLGILLWGEPGCGKTGFIKSIMNLTGRHGINIKLNNKFDMNLLKDLIYDEELGTDLVIPQNKRIIIFEDIDCMSDVVIDRDIKKQKELLKETKETKDKDKEIKEELDNNNLSYLLNILDGLQECTGRIIIMTTNKPELLDKALIRSGRIDYKLHFTNATIEDIQNILNFYWEQTYDGYILDKNINEKYSHADIVNMCRTSTTLLETLSKL